MDFRWLLSSERLSAVSSTMRIVAFVGAPISAPSSCGGKGRSGTAPDQGAGHNQCITGSQKHPRPPKGHYNAIFYRQRQFIGAIHSGNNRFKLCSAGKTTAF
ncbi:hypothetical protein Sp245p_30465 (plasmid) [Azospirillum baldaniorum]|uniref:Uncharacterized protein n=1 Tax=Azospirillum baldaniorum TaxID=1064539 RepID=A0A9P1JX91_9PROT|nr:hypothetical protein Sp245p_30465 [Azospirillum baldaniorum]CCD01444.1 protein of unknown function [Azospirillum baldaniorum]